jgi:hemoglobin/transferrin/lactoferrin receptor protein
MHFPLRPLALALLSPAALTPALAQSGLAPITVTAKGYEADALATPASVYAADGDELRRNGAGNLGEALRGEPGFAVASDGAQGQNPVIRGLKKEGIVLLVDGMRLNSAQPAGAIASFMSLGLAERVEAVKGPASVLYGTGAIGGAINVLLPQARFEPGLKVLAAGASYDSASRGLRGAAVANLSQGDHALMAGASLASIGDYEAPDGRVPRTGYDADAFIGQYRWRIDGTQQLRVSLQHQRDTDVWYPGSTRPNPNPAIRSTTVRSPEQARMLAEVGWSYKAAGSAPLRLDVRAWRQEMERNIWSYAEGLGRENSRTRVTFATTGVDARADWAMHPQHLVSFGTNVWRMEASPERFLANPPAFAFVRNDPFRDGSVEALGLYVQDDMQFGKLNVLAGLRYDTVEGSAASVGNGAVTTGLERRDSAWSGSLGAVYEIAPLLRPYVSVSRGFRAGEMRERFESSPRGDGYFYVGNPQIRPETSTQFELGLKGAAERASWQLAAWRARISDYITGQDISGTAQATTVCGANAAACKLTTNLGSVTLTGLEAQGKWEAWRGHWLKAGLAMVRGDNDPLNEPLFQMPADELSLGWEGRVADGWTADVTGRFVARQDRVATLFARRTENATPGYATADLGATYRVNRQTMRLALTNVFDRRYREHLTEGVSGQEIRRPGRSLVVSWQGKF